MAIIEEETLFPEIGIKRSLGLAFQCIETLHKKIQCPVVF